MNYLVVGSGLFGAVFAHEAAKKGHDVTVIEKRDHIGGNIYTKNVDGINVHQYGAHIFHTSNKMIWEYINQFGEFNNFVNAPLAIHQNQLYNLPFNMNTFHALWGVKTPKEAEKIIAEQRLVLEGPAKNLEEQALSLVGRDIYETLIKGYTEKQWGRSCLELPAFIINRLPVRFTFDNNYFNDRYQGIPVGGYTAIIENMLSNSKVSVQLNTDFFNQKDIYMAKYDKIIYTGMIDEFFDYCYGELEYRSLSFTHERLEEENYQGNAVVNYIDKEIPYTRIIEHKHFEFGTQEHTVITKEYPCAWSKGMEPYYPVNNADNNRLYKKYKQLAEETPNIVFGGRLGMYRYFDMHQVIDAALLLCQREL